MRTKKATDMMGTGFQGPPEGWLYWNNWDLFNYARERDQLIWITDAVRKHRDAVLFGGDSKAAVFELIRRIDECKAANDKLAAWLTPTEQSGGAGGEGNAS